MESLSFEDVRYATNLCAQYDIDFQIDMKIDALPDVTGIEAISVFSLDTVIVYPANIIDSDRFRAVMRHEVHGHFVLRRTHTAEELRDLARQVVAKNRKSPLFKMVAKAYDGSPVEMLGEEFVAATMEREPGKHDFAAFGPAWLYRYMRTLQNIARMRMTYDERNHDVACCRVR